MKLPNVDLELQLLEDAARTIKAASDADQVNVLVNRIRRVLDEQTNADVYCAVAHIMGMIAASEGMPSYAIPAITLLAMQSHTRLAEQESMH